MKLKKKKKDSVSKLKKVLDKVYSVYVRRKDATFQGHATCYTCGTTLPWQILQCGHFITRQCNQLRYDPRNTRPQCFSCNVWRHGNIDVYAMRLVQEYGPEILKTLNQEKQKVKQFKTAELEGLISLYKKKLKNLDEI